MSSPAPGERLFPPTSGVVDTSTFATSVSTTKTPASLTSQYTYLPTSQTFDPAIPTFTGADFTDDDDDGIFDGLEHGAKAGVGIAITIGVIIIVVMSVWFCCGCCGLRIRRKKRREGLRAPPIDTQRQVPLATITPGPAPPPTSDAPPQYEEAVPPRHQHIAGGARHGVEEHEEEAGVISDGKTPLSEIAFEDVVLDHSPSEGSSRSFGERHHGIGGDTRGHTNT